MRPPAGTTSRYRRPIYTAAKPKTETTLVGFMCILVFISCYLSPKILYSTYSWLVPAHASRAAGREVHMYVYCILYHGYIIIPLQLPPFSLLKSSQSFSS